ncbi:hypothetical protein T484DRAFT_1956136 [Baffinella frigidus]|nr:hypothetical protein T484DRAFT_1956136 [Cryptophyta sp. CCMP2293]
MSYECQPTLYPPNCRPILPTTALSCQPTPYSLPTDALSTANCRPIHCQPMPCPLPTDAVSTAN